MMNKFIIDNINNFIGKNIVNPIYRGKDKNDNWHIGYLFFKENKPYILNTLNFIEYEVLEPTICRCTGEKLSEHSYIFEGDIISWYCDWDGLDGFSHCCKEQGYIIWSDYNKSFKIVVEGDTLNWDDVFLSSDTNDIWIVGNIYDNYELVDNINNLLNN